MVADALVMLQISHLQYSQKMLTMHFFMKKQPLYIVSMIKLSNKVHQLKHIHN